LEVLVVGLSLDWFADRHIGKDVWVVGSDASLSGFGPELVWPGVLCGPDGHRGEYGVPAGAGDVYGDEGGLEP